MRATQIEGLNALLQLHVTDNQNTRDQITSDRRFKRAWSNCILYIPRILSGSPNKCWLHTCDACVITTWRLGLRAPLVARNKMKKPYLWYPPSLPVSSSISGGKLVIKSLPTREIAVVFVYSIKSRRRFNSHAKRTVRVSTGFTSLLFAMRTSTVDRHCIPKSNHDHFHP